MKEWWRKQLVTLKRHPNYIPLFMIIVCCIVFNFSLTNFSNTIAMINEPGMGVCSFVIVLCSFLSIITYLSAFPRRQPVKKMSIILVYTMLVLSIICDAIFYYFIIYGTELKAIPIVIDASRQYIIVARNICIIHIILVALTIILMLLLPFYSKTLQKIKTNIEIEDVEIDEIDISDDDKQ